MWVCVKISSFSPSHGYLGWGISGTPQKNHWRYPIKQVGKWVIACELHHHSRVFRCVPSHQDQWIGFREIYWLKPPYLMGKSMVSGEDSPWKPFRLTKRHLHRQFDSLVHHPHSWKNPWIRGRRSWALLQLMAGWWLTFPSEKWVRQWGWLSPIYGEKKNVPNHQPGMV